MMTDLNNPDMRLTLKTVHPITAQIWRKKKINKHLEFNNANLRECSAQWHRLVVKALEATLARE